MAVGLPTIEGMEFHTAHKLARMPPAMRLCWFLACRTEAASFLFSFSAGAKWVTSSIPLSVPGFSATNPKQPGEFDTRRGKRQRVERIRNIDERAGLLPFGGLCKQGESQARPPGGSGTAQFDERPARETSTEHRSSSVTPLGWSSTAAASGILPVPDPLRHFEFSVFSREIDHGLIFAFCSPYLGHSHQKREWCQVGLAFSSPAFSFFFG